MAYYKNSNKVLKVVKGYFPLATVSLCLLGSSFFSTLSANAQSIGFETAPQVSEETCVVELLREGTLGASANSRVLNSQINGGEGAQIRVTSRKRLAGDNPNARFRVVLTPPTTFTSAPTGGDTDVTFRTRMSGTSIDDGVDFNIRNGTNSRGLPRIGTSVTLVTGHLRARKNSGVFPGGEYRAVATFLCE